MTHHSEPAEAVARALREHFGTSSTTIFTAREAGRQAASVALRHLSASPAPAAGAGEAVRVSDWLAVAKAAGEHGVRYRTNRALEAFLTDIRQSLQPDTQALADAYMRGWNTALAAQPDTQAAAASAPAQAEALPAGVDAVREALDDYHSAYSDYRMSPDDSWERGFASQKMEEAYDKAKALFRALSSAPAQEGRADG